MPLLAGVQTNAGNDRESTRGGDERRDVGIHKADRQQAYEADWTHTSTIEAHTFDTEEYRETLRVNALVDVG